MLRTTQGAYAPTFLLITPGRVMRRTASHFTAAVLLLAGAAIVTGCAGSRPERVASGEMQEPVIAVAREREAELSALRAEMAATRIAAAKKEAELMELRALVAQLRQEQTENHQRLLELRQTVEVRQAETNALKAERDQWVAARNDQSIKELKDGLLVLTKQLEDVRQGRAHTSARPADSASRPSSHLPAGSARPEGRPSASGILPSLFQATPTAQPQVTVLAISNEQPTEPVTRIRVRRGDSLSSRARDHQTSVAAIRQLNQLTHDGIAIGQELILPSAKGSFLERER